MPITDQDTSDQDISDHDIAAGQSVYSKRTLRIYDWLVLGFSNRFVWKCPTKHLLRLYDRHITGNHLDVGVGTGFFLDRCTFPSEQPRNDRGEQPPNEPPRVALLDLNENCLRAAAARIRRYHPEIYQRDLFRPLDLQVERFDSIGLNYVLHCLPGTMQSKGLVLDHLKSLLNPDGTLFGSTILASGVPRGILARRLMNFYNKRRVFTNSEDSLQSLEEVLRSRFQRVTIETRGCVALFAAH